MPEIDLVMGTSGFSKIAQELDKLNSTKSDSTVRGPIIATPVARLKDYDLPRVNSQPFYTAYLKLAEGCAKNCSFCIIPKLRGPLRSRGILTLRKEAEDLVKTGVKELNLIAQDLTDYGRDRKDGASLAKLLKELVTIDGLEWIRLFYAYPDQLDDEVIELIKNEPKICKYLDVPVQHISDSVLDRMNRKSSSEQILGMVKKLKSEIPEIVLRTSLMVGFPGETENDFEQLKNFVKEGHFEQIGVFVYSHEEGTPSAKKFADDIPEEIKESRRAELYELQLKTQSRSLKNWVGKKVQVLIEGPHEETDLLIKSRHFGQAPGIDNTTLINSGYAKKGDFAWVEITEVVGPDLVGSIVS
jgi:ribosomal protein S12 methylthiotransferase